MEEVVKPPAEKHREKPCLAQIHTAEVCAQERETLEMQDPGNIIPTPIWHLAFASFGLHLQTDSLLNHRSLVSALTTPTPLKCAATAGETQARFKTRQPQICQQLTPHTRATFQWQSHIPMAGGLTHSVSRPSSEVTYPSLPEKSTRTLEMRALHSEVLTVGFPEASLPSLRLILM